MFKQLAAIFVMVWSVSPVHNSIPTSAVIRANFFYNINNCSFKEAWIVSGALLAPALESSMERKWDVQAPAGLFTLKSQSSQSQTLYSTYITAEVTVRRYVQRFICELSHWKCATTFTHIFTVLLDLLSCMTINSDVSCCSRE